MIGERIRATLPERPLDGRLVAGVCAGIGRRLELDVTLVRIAAVILILASGLGLVLYGALWIAMPEPRDGASREGRGAFARTASGVRFDVSHAARAIARDWNRLERSRWPRPLGRRWIALVAIGAGVLLLLASFGAFDWLNGTRAIGLVAIAVGVGVLVAMRGGGAAG